MITVAAKTQAVIGAVGRFFHDHGTDNTSRPGQADWLRMLAGLRETYDVHGYDITGRERAEYEALLWLFDAGENCRRDLVELDERPGHPEYPALKADWLDRNDQDIRAKAQEIAHG
ncbi:hypothetical protein [Zhihengliuella halotolerans]|uniref:hypothetical protein n=1 Tax=Zhihengliuella halotolerans TaxID=370736 RepID=UPI000C80121E|nr:hypothetical protein [Zhihengliuella halotolerans]